MGNIDKRGPMFCSLRKHREIYLLASPALAHPHETAKLPRLCAALFLIPLRSSSPVFSSSRDLLFAKFLSPPPPPPPPLFFPPSFSRTLFSEAKGRDPGAAVRYDTGIGYKETINHSSGREWDPGTARATLNGKFLPGLSADGRKEREAAKPASLYERVTRKTGSQETKSSSFADIHPLSEHDI